MQARSFTRRILGFAAATLMAGAFAVAHAAYPDKPVRLVIGFPPGGGGDLYGRAIGNELAKQLKQPVVIDNVVGAGGNIAADKVAKSPPDGYTLILAMSGNFGSSVAIRPSSMPYKVPEDFEPVSLLVETPFGLMVAADSPYKTIKDYVEAAKGGKLTYASTGTGGAAQIVMEMVKQNARLGILHIPYKGSGPVMTDLLGGRVDSFFAPYTPLMGQINSGKLRLLAVSSDKRVPSLPNVPTLKESGIDVVMSQWYGLAAPAGTPKDVVESLEKGVKAAMQAPELLRVYRADGAREGHLQGTAFRDFIIKDLANYKRAVERGNLKAE